MLVIWIGLLFGSSLQISSCDTNEISWTTHKTVPDLTSFEKEVHISNNSIQNSGTRTEGIENFQVVEEGPKNVESPSNESNVLVKRDTGQENGYSTLGGDQLRNLKQYELETNGDRFRNVIGYEKDSGDKIRQKDLENMKDGLENNEGGRLASDFAQFYQPVGRSYLGELGHKVSKLFGRDESPDYYEKPFGSPNIYSHFQRHEENLNNALTFRDVVEGNKAAVRKDVNSAEGDLSRIFQENESSNDENDDFDDSWLMSSMASDQSIIDDGQSPNIFDNGEDFEETKVIEPLNNDANDGFNERNLRQIEQTEKSDELLIDAQDMNEGGETINAENIDSILQGDGAINDENIDSIVHESRDSIENLNLIRKTEENSLSGVEDTFEVNILSLEGNNDGSSLLGNNNMKRDVGVPEKFGSGDVKSEIMDTDRLKMYDSSLEDYKIGKMLDSDQNVSLESSQDLVTASEVSSSNDETLKEEVVSGGNLDLESKLKNKHKRNEMHRMRNKIHSKIVDKQDALPLNMDDSLYEQSPPISSIDNGGGILLKDLDLQDENKIPDTNEVKDSKPFSSQSSQNDDIRNNDKFLVSNDQGFKLPLQGNSVNSSIEVVADVSSFNSESEAKLNQNSLGESIMESMDGVKTLKLSSVNFKADESNFSNDESSSANKNPVRNHKLHYAATRHPIKLSHGNKHKKINGTKGRIVSSYHRNGLLKHTSTSPVSVLDSRDNLFNSKLFIRGKDRPSTRKQSSNIIKKGFKDKEEKLDGFYTYDTTTKAKRIHNIKKNGKKHKSGISNAKMVKVKLSVSPCQFNKEKYLINNKSASKSSVPKILSSRSVKQDQKQLKTSTGGGKSNTNVLKMLSEGKFDVNTQKMLKREKLNAMKPSKGKKLANNFENPNFFDRSTTFSSTSTLQQTSNSGQGESQTNKKANKNLETKNEKSNLESTTLASAPQKEINDVPSSTTRKSGLVPMKTHSARRKHEKSGHVPGEKLENASLNEDDACDGDNDEDDDEYSDSCDKTTKSVCKTTKSECSTTESTDEEDICDPLENDNNDVETDGPCEPEEDETTKVPCGTTQAPCVTTEDQCGTTQAPCATTEDLCGTTQSPCETTCETTEAPCETFEPICETTEVQCGTTQAPCETTEVPCGTTKALCETTEDLCGTTQAPCETTEAPCGTTQAPCETTCETTEAPCETFEATCETTEAQCGTTQAPCETTQAPCGTTQAPCETTEAPCGTTQAPCETTEAPCGTTQAPCETTCETTEAPCETTEAPCGTTQAPCETTKALCETTEPQCQSTEASCETTENPCTTTCKSSPPPCETSKAECDDEEEVETDPPCQTTKICKTASKKGNSTSEEKNEYVESNGDEDDDDEYDYENE